MLNERGTMLWERQINMFNMFRTTNELASEGEETLRQSYLQVDK